MWEEAKNSTVPVELNNMRGLWSDVEDLGWWGVFETSGCWPTAAHQLQA
jgi:hypothetical protein